MKTGILIEIENNTVKETSLGVMAAAQGHEIAAILLNGDPAAVKETLAAYGAASIVNITSDSDLAADPDLAARALAEVIKAQGLSAMLGTASAEGKDLFARLAAFMDLPLAADALGVDLDKKQVKKSHFSGKVIATLQLNTDVVLCTIRPNTLEPVKADGTAEIVEFKAATDAPGITKVVETITSEGAAIDLTEAPVIVSGGRAIGDKENFKMIEACAAKLGGAVGASRAAVDSGYATHSRQVGQTGKTVSPKLYIACGISGAVQHFAGMKTSKVIVAINKDKDAPIFGRCDYGIVGDIFEVVPALTEKL